jgi:para-aminobenzoate synthetase component 1
MNPSAHKFEWPFSRCELEKKIFHLIQKHDTYALLSSNDFYKGFEAHSSPVYSAYQLVVGVGCRKRFDPKCASKFEALKSWIDEHRCWYFGHFSYDLKNELEQLKSENRDPHNFQDIYGFIPEWVLTLQGKEVALYTDTHEDAVEIWHKLKDVSSTESQPTGPPLSKPPEFQSDFSKATYIDRVNKLIKHIEAGDIYEVNFCQAFYASNVSIDPVSLYQNLMAANPTPFACLYRFGDACVISASMERFMYKKSGQLVSQPIKGTVKRGENEIQDKELMNTLQNDVKERAENVMIVDLVRNDLAKAAKTGSVKVDELFGIYPFPSVHQMISTISANLKAEAHAIDALKGAFPMGSMTGAPKVRAMQLIEYYEAFKRSIFSGAIGYITPWQDFDFNVVIRSFLYNLRTGTLTLPVGSAITYDADPAKEYEECMLKIEKLKRSLYEDAEKPS